MLWHDLPGGARLRLLEESDAEELVCVVEANRDHLAPWMPWVEDTSNTAGVRREFIRGTRRQLAENDGFQAAIVENDDIVGVIGFHGVDWRNRATSLGYWLTADRQGRGIMTAAVAALTTHAFEVWGLNRLEIRVATGNSRSAAVPERLGFEREGVLRQAERHGEAFYDLVVYSMLARDWDPARARRP